MARSYLNGKEKGIITFLVIILVLGGIVTLRSQIKYGSPIGLLFNIIPPAAQTTIEPEPVVQYQTAQVNSNGLNLRPMPNTNNNPIKVLPRGTRVRVISVDNYGWARVIDDAGVEGYLYNEYLRY